MQARRIWVTGGAALFVVAVVAGIGAGWWLWSHLQVRLELRHQPMRVRIPEAVPVSARILNKLEITLDTKVTTSVPVNQVISVPLGKPLRVRLHFDHRVPIRVTVPIHASIPVEQKVHIDSQVTVTVLGTELTLPIRGDVPIHATIPIDLKVPVHQMVHLEFSAPARVSLQQPLSVPLKTRIHTTIPIHSTLKVPVRAPLKASVSFAKPFSAVLVRTRLRLPLEALEVGLIDGEAEQGGSGNRGNTREPVASSLHGNDAS